MKDQEKVTQAQHIQIRKLQEQKKSIEEHTKELEVENQTQSDQLDLMEKELAEMSTMLGLNLENVNLSMVEGLVDLTTEELEAIEKRIVIPSLEVIEFEDWNNFVAKSKDFLQSEGVTFDDDPIFQMLSKGEIKDVLDKYRHDYGEILLDWKDYGIVLLASILAGIFEELAPNKFRKWRFGKELKILDEWKDFATEQLVHEIENIEVFRKLEE